MNLTEFATSLKAKIDAIALPEWTYSVTHSTSFGDSVDVRFADQPKEKWAYGIWHNANNLLLTVDERGRSREVGRGPYQLRVSLINNLPRLIGKTGTLEQIERYIVSYFTKLKTSAQPTPIVKPQTADQVVESLLENNGATTRPFDLNAAYQEALTYKGCDCTLPQFKAFKAEFDRDGCHSGKIPLRIMQFLDWKLNHETPDFTFDDYIAQDLAYEGDDEDEY